MLMYQNFILVLIIAQHFSNNFMNINVKFSLGYFKRLISINRDYIFKNIIILSS